MASGTAPPPLQHGSPPPPPPSRGETLIDERLRHTQRQVKGLDVVGGLLTLTIGGLAYLFLAALIDHWVVSGGLGFWGRFTLFLILAAASGAYFVWQVLPPLIHRINPLFAAHTIEQSRPSLKNSLINLLFLRGQRAQIERDLLAKRIYEGLEQTAAADLAQVSADAAVDHSPVIRKGYWLAAILAVCALYLALSPKNPLTSFGRVVFPWAGIRAPTRVTIDRVEPGDGVVSQGEYVTISAEVRGLKPDEPVLVYYTTADGQSVNQAVPMTLSEGEYRRRCQLPPGALGMQQETTYYLVAGDSTTRPYRLEVQPALSIQVDSVDYHYPEYTGVSDRTVERQGDVRAVEGTQITLHATASQAIQRATIEMDCDPRFELHMTPSGTTAVGQFTLAMSRDRQGRAQHESYQVRFRDADGRENPRPTRYRIEVIPDLVPDIHLIEPPPDEAKLPVNGSVDFRVRAEDPDYALRYVALRMEVEGKSLPIRPLLNKIRPDKPHQGPFEAVYHFEPAKLGLKPGDKVVYLAEAKDNKEPIGNHSRTQQRTILIVPPEEQKSQQDGSGQGGQKSGQPDAQGEKPDRSKQDSQSQKGQENEKSQDQQKQPPDQPGKQGRQQADQSQEKPDSAQPPESKSQDQQGNRPDQGGQGDASAGQSGKGQSGKPQGKQEEQSAQQGGQGTKQDGTAQGMRQDGGGQAGKQSPAEQKPVDGQSNPGDVFEKVLQRREEQEKKGGSQSGAGQQAADGNQQGTSAKQQGTSTKQDSSGAAAEPAPRGSQQPAAGQQKPGQETPSAPQPESKKEGGQEKPAGPSPDGQPQPAGEPGAKGGSRQAKESQTKPPQAADAQAGTPERGQPQRVPDNDQGEGKRPGSAEKPEPGQGMQAKGAGQPDKDKEQSPGPKSGERPEQRGGDREGSSGSPGAGKPAQDSKGMPSPQEDNRERPKNAGAGDQKASEQRDQATSPSNSPKSSNSQGEVGGDRSGGGEQGGGQAAKQSGAGTAGTHSAAEQGGSKSDQKGEGETGTKGGDQAKADRPTGHPASQGEGPGSSGKDQPGAEKPGGQPTAGQEPGSSGRPGTGLPGGGGADGPPPGTTTPPPAADTQGDPYNREFAEKQTTLALEYLKDQLAKEKPDPTLLDRLGWSRQDLEKFVERWEAMRKAAAEPGPAGQTAKRRLDDALKSLGLRPAGTQLRGGQTRRDQLRNLKDAGRSEPPPEWSELFRAYNRGVGGSRE